MRNKIKRLKKDNKLLAEQTKLMYQVMEHEGALITDNLCEKGEDCIKCQVNNLEIERKTWS